MFASRRSHTEPGPLTFVILPRHRTAVAPFRIIRAAAPYMRIKEPEKQENRSVVFVSSTSGTHGNVGQLNYSAAKSGTCDGGAWRTFVHGVSYSLTRSLL